MALKKKSIGAHSNHYETLRLIKLFYDVNKSGCQSAGVLGDEQVLLYLKKAGLIFLTKEGYFPTTEGQEFVNKTEEAIKARAKRYLKYGLPHRDHPNSVRKIAAMKREAKLKLKLKNKI